MDGPIPHVNTPTSKVPAPPTLTLVGKAANLLKWLIVPGSYGDLPLDEVRVRRRRKSRYLVRGFLFLLIALTIGTISIKDTGGHSPLTDDIAIALMVNLLIILLLIMSLLVARNLVKLYVEWRGNVAGARFQTKLVISFLFMTFVPAALMFAVATELISDTVDKWLNARIEGTLEESLQVAQSLYQESKTRTEVNTVYLAGVIEQRGLYGPRLSLSLNRLLRQKIREYDVDLIQVYDQAFVLVAEASRADTPVTFAIAGNPEIMANAALGETITRVEERPGASMVISIAPVIDERDGRMRGVVVAAKEVTRKLIERVFSISNAFDDYKRLTAQKEIIKSTYQVTLALVALVVIFSAIWIGFYLAKGITVPLSLLSEATEEIATGNLDIIIDIPVQDDEVGQLVTAFNRMTNDLRLSKAQIEQANQDLTLTNTELFRHGQYMEAVLENVAGGVVTIDRAGSITTINGSAVRMVGFATTDEAKGKSYRAVFDPAIHGPIREMVREMALKNAVSTERELSVATSGESVRTFKVAVSVLLDKAGEYSGAVIVFDDLTDVIAAQRATTLREMARVVAHEIKNPLTPIQLNVQRARRKFDQGSDDFGRVFVEATDTIIAEVEQLKLLVNKFSQVAKLSEAIPGEAQLSAMRLLDLSPAPARLNDLVEEVARLYRDIRAEVSLETDLDPAIRLIHIDAEQMRRVLVNLVENAMDAINGTGSVIIRTRRHSDQRRVVIEVVDSGAGLTESVQDRLFMPYVTTKPHGAGLGLAIVARIIEDHGGIITAASNDPAGAVFTIELPED
jgi:two-component system nitrogen regulation sensor histidine kinase NtrY